MAEHDTTAVEVLAAIEERAKDVGFGTDAERLATIVQMAADAVTEQPVSETAQHTPKRDEWCDCECHTGRGCRTQLTLIYDRILPLAAERDRLREEKAELLAALESVRLGAKLAAQIIPAESGYQGWVVPIEETARAAIAKVGGIL